MVKDNKDQRFASPAAPMNYYTPEKEYKLEEILRKDPNEKDPNRKPYTTQKAFYGR